jgi:hypothetical protein
MVLVSKKAKRKQALVFSFIAFFFFVLIVFLSKASAFFTFLLAEPFPLLVSQGR